MHRTFLHRLCTLLCAVIFACSVLFTATWAAQQVRSSDLYTRSRLIRLIVQEEQISLTDMAHSRRNVELLLRFVGAVTGAYIDFELIPVGEAHTFVVLFESIPQTVSVTHLEYHQKNLCITGNAPDLDTYFAFASNLRETDYFDDVVGQVDISSPDAITFSLLCISKSNAEGFSFLSVEL